MQTGGRKLCGNGFQSRKRPGEKRNENTDVFGIAVSIHLRVMYQRAENNSKISSNGRNKHEQYIIVSHHLPLINRTCTYIIFNAVNLFRSD